MIDDDKCFAQKMLEPGGHKIFHPDAFSKETAFGAEQPSTRGNNKKKKRKPEWERRTTNPP